MRVHLAGGGLILAATHGPIGLEGSPELRLDGNFIPQDETAEQQ
jgi:ABC-type transport system involved in cytochrome c biogenesis ATPase subunit